MKKYFAEMVGTFILVLFGCGTAVVAGDKVGILGIAFAFGLALIGGSLRNRTHLRLPYQSRCQPWRLVGRPYEDWRHDRLLDRPVRRRHPRGRRPLAHRSRRRRRLQHCRQRPRSGRLGTRLPGRIQRHIRHRLRIRGHVDLCHRHSRRDAESRSRGLRRPRHRHSPSSSFTSSASTSPASA